MRKIHNKAIWISQETFPNIVNHKQKRFSIDVFVYFPRLEERSIGFYDYKNKKWLFLVNQDYSKEVFQWRYFIDKFDRPEIWKDLSGYEDFYQISNSGRIWTNDRWVSNGKQMILRKGFFVKPNPVGNGGYLQVKLTKNNKQKCFMVSRLVGKHFLENPLNLPEINHKDEDNKNNWDWNLEWCTRKYNVNYGTRTRRASESNKKTIIRIDPQGNHNDIEYKSIKDVLKDGFIPSCVQRCCSGKRKSHRGFVWNYKFNN